MGAGTIEVPVVDSVCGAGIARHSKPFASIEETIIVEFIETGFMSEIGDGINKTYVACDKAELSQVQLWEGGLSGEL